MTPALAPAFSVDGYDIPSFSKDGSLVFAVGKDKVLRAYDTKTGGIRWSLSAPKGKEFTFEQAYQGDVIVGYRTTDAFTRGLCRIAQSGAQQWCRDMERPIRRLEQGLNGAGIMVFSHYYDGLVLDPENGTPIGEWLTGGEMHIYYDLGEPHDTEFYPGASLLGQFGSGPAAVYVVATNRNLIGMSPTASAAWTLDLEQARATMGSAGGAGVFPPGCA